LNNATEYIESIQAFRICLPGIFNGAYLYGKGGWGRGARRGAIWFLKISAIREIGPERIEVELELTPAAARDPINLESLGLRDVQIGTRESRSGGRSVWLTGSGDFFGSVGDTVRLLPMSGIKREPRRKVYWREIIWGCI